MARFRVTLALNPTVSLEGEASHLRSDLYTNAKSNLETLLTGGAFDKMSEEDPKQLIKVDHEERFTYTMTDYQFARLPPLLI